MTSSNDINENVGSAIERVSTLPTSIKQIYLTGNDSLDTFHLLSNTSSRQYANTSQFHTSKALEASPSSSKKEERGLQQVPKRFSNFIIEQSTNNTNQDNISDVSSYIRDINSMLNLPKSKKSSTNLKKEPSALILSNYSTEKVGSQATIFSTRPEHEELVNSGSNTKSKSQKFQSNTSSLKRSKAIKNKLGSKIHRFQLKLKKILKKLKNIKFKFRVSSKRTGSISRSKSLNKNKKNKNKSINKTLRGGAQVSAPVNNPNLGVNKVEFVDNLKDIQELAGKCYNNNPNEKIKITSFPEINNPKSQIEPPTTQYGGPIISEQSKKILENERSVEIESETESVAPAPPPHAHFQGDDSNLNTNVEKETLIQLWRSYLSIVIQKRIQLRHEINLFQKLLVNHDNNHEFTVNLSRQSSYSKTSVYPSENNVNQETESQYSYSSSSDGYDEFDNEDPMINDFTEEFNKNYKNRRSILGDMLEYDSDDCLTLTSISTLSPSQNESHIASMYHRKTYGTISSRTRSVCTSVNSRRL